MTNSSSPVPPEWKEQAQKFFRNVVLKYHTPTELCGPCPKCGGKDRFIVFAAGNYWCRQCSHSGQWRKSDPEEIQKIKQDKILSQQKLLKIMQTCKDWQVYHKTNPECIQCWKNEGFSELEIDVWNLGYCKVCPLFQASPSLTIPAFYKGILYDIRHRLVSPPDENNKYRTHLQGLTPPFFNMDSLFNDKIIYVMEGEKKVIKASSCGLKSVIGIPGLNYVDRLVNSLNQKISPDQRIVFIPDPGTINKICIAASKLDRPSYIVEMMMKPDDLISQYGQQAFINAISIPRPI